MKRCFIHRDISYDYELTQTSTTKRAQITLYLCKQCANDPDIAENLFATFEKYSALEKLRQCEAFAPLDETLSGVIEPEIQYGKIEIKTGV